MIKFRSGSEVGGKQQGKQRGLCWRKNMKITITKKKNLSFENISLENSQKQMTYHCNHKKKKNPTELRTMKKDFSVCEKGKTYNSF